MQVKVEICSVSDLSLSSPYCGPLKFLAYCSLHTRVAHLFI